MYNFLKFYFLQVQVYFYSFPDNSIVEIQGFKLCMSPLKNTRRSQPNELKVVEEYKYPDSEKNEISQCQKNEINFILYMDFVNMYHWDNG